MDDLDLGSTVKGFSPGQKVFSRYTLRKILGRGGMGVVWLARDDELEREVALKFLPELVAMDSEALRDLKRETRRSLELTHPHVIRIYDFVQDERMAAISMEYVAGDTLAQRKGAQAEQCFDPEELLPWLTQLVEALDHAHRKARVVHRDLKPANLMIDAHGDLKIADFGIAASVSDSVSRVSAQAGSSGTPVFMSPQQMMGEKPAVTDDIYSVGATLFDLLTGKPPFHSGNVVAQVQSRVAPSLADRRLELGVKGRAPIPAVWEQVIAACLAKDPAARPQGARELLERLQGRGPAPAEPAAPAARAVPAAAAPAPTPVAVSEAAPELPKISSSRRWWWAPFAASLPWSLAFLLAVTREWLTAPDSEGMVLVIAVVGFIVAVVAQYAFFAVLLAIRRPWKVRSPFGIMTLGGALGAAVSWGVAAAGDSVAVAACAVVGGITGALQGWLLHRLAVGVRPEDAERARARRPLTYSAAVAAGIVTVVFFGMLLPQWEHEHAENLRIAREERERYEAEKFRLEQEELARAEQLRREEEARKQREEDARKLAQFRQNAAKTVTEAYRSVFAAAPSAAEQENYIQMMADSPSMDLASLRQAMRESPAGQKGGRLHVPAEFATIGEAITAAVPGNAIHVGPGTYQEGLMLSKNVSLVGAGADRVVVETPADDAALHVSGASGITISGFTFRHSSTKEEATRTSVVSIVGCSLTFRNNTVDSANGHGMHLKGEGRNVVLSNVFRNSRWSGLAIYGGTHSEVTQNQLLDNQQTGISVLESVASAALSRNTFRGNKWNGLWVAEGANVTLVDNSATANGTSGQLYGGIGIGKGSPRLRGNTSQGNIGQGIWWRAEATPQIEAGNVSDGQALAGTP